MNTLTSCARHVGYFPTWPSGIVEATVVLLFVAALLNAYGQGRRWFFTLICGSLTGYAAEAYLVSRPEARYGYGLELFLLKLLDVPICVALGWGLVFYASTWTAQRLAARTSVTERSFKTSLVGSSFVAGALGVNLDLSFDPVATAHGFWMWRTWTHGVCSVNTSDMPWTMFGVPYDNFMAWMVGIGVYGLVVRGLFHYWNKKSQEELGPGIEDADRHLLVGMAARLGKSGISDVAIPVGGGVAAGLAFVGIRVAFEYIYGWLGTVRPGLFGETFVFAVLFFIGLLLTGLAVLHGSRTEEPNPLVLSLVVYFHLTSFLLLITTHTARPGGLAPLVVIIPINFAVGLIAYAWPSLDPILAAVRARARKKGTLSATDDGAWAPPIVRRTLSSYGGDKVRALVAEPENERQLLGLLAYAREAGLKVTFRSAGLAFDHQSLNDQLVISLVHFDKIDLRATEDGNAEVVVGCSAVWGDILKVTLEAGFAPYVMVTTAAASAGGTVSSHSLSRFSPSVGREGKYVKRLRVLTPDGKIVSCSHEDARSTPEHALFNAVIGGLGYAGAILEVTYALHKLPAKDAVVKTTFTLVEGLARTANALTPNPGVRFTPLIRPFVEHVCDRCAMNGSAPGPSALSAVVNLRGGAWGLLADSHYAPNEKLKPSVFHSPSSVRHLVLQACALFPGLRSVGYWLTYRAYAGEPKAYVDGLHGYTFFEDGNRLIRRVLHWFGVPGRVLQQTFMIQCDVSDPSGAAEALTSFLTDADREFDQRGIDPALIDVLYVGRDPRDFVLSSSRGLDAFAVTFTFERLLKSLDKEVEAMRALSRACANRNGRVHLVKHVFADQGILGNMYGQALLDLRAVRDRHGGTLLANEFSQRALPGI